MPDPASSPGSLRRATTGAAARAGAAVAAAIAAALLAHQAYLSIVGPDVLYMDSLRLLWHLDEFRDGRMAIAEVWGYGISSHRGLITQAFLLANAWLFDVDVLLANRLTGAVIALTGALMALAFVRDAQRRTPWAGAAWSRRVVPAAAVIAVLGFSLIGFELLTLDLGLPLWFKNLCFVAYFVAHARHVERPTWSGTAALCFLGAGIVLVVAMAWAYAFVGAAIGAYGLYAFREGRRVLQPRLLMPPAALVAGLAIYVVAGGGAGDGMTAATLVSGLPRAALQSLHALGAGFVGIEAGRAAAIPPFAVAAAGALLLAAALGLTIAWLRRRIDASLVPLQLIGYSVLMAASVAMARGALGTDAVMASRYYMDVYLAQCGVVWLATLWYGQRGTSLRSAGIAAVLVIAGLGGQVVSNRIEWRTAPYRAAAFDRMEQAIVDGVPDEAAARLVQSPLVNAQRGVRVMREWRVSTYARMAPPASCDASALRLLEGWHDQEPHGRWTSGRARLHVPACRCELAGTLYLPPGFRTRTLRIDGAPGGNRVLTLTPGEPSPLRLPPSGGMTLTLRLDATTVPRRDLSQPDIRELGVLVSPLAFACGATSNSSPQ